MPVTKKKKKGKRIEESVAISTTQIYRFFSVKVICMEVRYRLFFEIKRKGFCILTDFVP